MRNIFIFILLVMLFSCRDKPNGNDSGADLSLKAISKNDADLIGEWQVYLTVDGNVATHCNACPRVIFKKNGVARIDFPDRSFQELAWERKDLKLIIRNASGHGIDAGEYLMKFEKEQEYAKLRLTKVESAYYYELGR